MPSALDELSLKGVDIDALARLAQASPKESLAKLKELGIAQMGARMRLQSDLLAHVPAETSSPVTTVTPKPAGSTKVPFAKAPTSPPAAAPDATGKLKMGHKLAIDRITKVKEQGNASVKENNMVAACEAYRNGLELARDSGVPAEALAPLLVSLHSNLCLCYITLKQWLSAKESADAALALDAQNVKSLLRRGSVLMNLGKPDGRRGSEEPVEVRAKRAAALADARADFMLVVKLEPNNREARQGLEGVKVLLAHNHKFEGFLQTKGRREALAAEAAEAKAVVEAHGHDCCGHEQGDAGSTQHVHDHENLPGAAAPHGVLRLPTRAAWDGCLSKAAAQGRAVVVDFTATWCGPCKAIAPAYEQMAQAFPWVTFVSVDVDQNQEVAAEQRITAMPTFKIYRDGVAKASMQGADVAKLHELVSAHAGERPRAPANDSGSRAVHGRVGAVDDEEDDDEDDGPAIVDITDEVDKAAAAEEEKRRRARIEEPVVIHDDDELEGVGAKGYVLRADGSTTTYFDRGTAHQVTPSQPAPAPVKLATSSPASKLPADGSKWNAAGTFEERDVSAWAKDRLGGMLALVECDDDRELVLEECACGTIEGTATAFTARGKSKCLFELSFEVLFTVTARVNAAKVCDARLVCEASNESGKPELEAIARLRTPVQSRDHEARVLGLAESSLKEEVMRTVLRFAEELASK